MKRDNILYMVMGVLFGSLLTIIIAATVVNSHESGMMKAMGMHTDGTNHSMNIEGM